MNNNNSWKIIKAYFVEDRTPKTFGYSFDLNRAIDMFMLLQSFLKDIDIAKEAMNKDETATEALLQRGNIKKMRESGLIH